MSYAAVLDRIYTIDTLAESLLVSRRTVCRAMADHVIGYTKVGKQVRFTEADRRAWLDLGRVKTTAELEAELDGVK